MASTSPAARIQEPLKIMISGAPASGKGTQCELINKKVKNLRASEFCILLMLDVIFNVKNRKKKMLKLHSSSLK